MSFCATSAAPTASESVRQWPTAFVPQKSIQRPKPIQFKNPELDSGSERRQVMMERFLILTETDKRLLLLPLSLLLRNLKWNQWKQKKKRAAFDWGERLKTATPTWAEQAVKSNTTFPFHPYPCLFFLNLLNPVWRSSFLPSPGSSYSLFLFTQFTTSQSFLFFPTITILFPLNALCSSNAELPNK